MPATRPGRVTFDGDEDGWEHELWDAAEIFDETTISAAFQQQLRRAVTKLDRDLTLGLQQVDKKFSELHGILQRLDRSPVPGNSELHSMLVVPSQSPAVGRVASSPKSWASPFQDSVEFLRTASERQAQSPPPQLNMFSSRRMNNPAKEALWNFLVDPLSSSAAMAFCGLYKVLVLMVVVCMLLQSVMSDILQPLLVAELALQLPFLAEALGRFSCTWTSLHYFSNPCNIIDLLALASMVFSVIALVEVNDVMMKIKWCVFPTLQMMKLLRFCSQFHVVLSAWIDCWDAIFMLLLNWCLLLLPLASVLFLLEPLELSASSPLTLPEALYEMLLVMATVGFGSSAPSTSSTSRQVLTALAVLGSMLCLVFPVAIIGGSNRWKDRNIETFARHIRRSLKDWGFPETFFEKVLVDFDSSGSGRALSLEDFHRLAQELHVSFSAQQLVPVFHALDVNQTGSVEIAELMHLLLPTRRRWPWAIPEHGPTLPP